MSTYNGHKNYDYWNVALCLSNDEGLYRLACECIRKTDNRSSAIDMLMQHLPTHTPDGAKYTKTNVRAALVDWA
jgi:hypothetical protein